MHVQSCCPANLNLLLFCRSLGRRCRTINNNDDNTALQRCSNVVTIRNNVATMLQRCNALKIVVANRPVSGVTSALKQPRRRRQQHKKGFNEQNNNIF